ncbi:MAG: type II toxin-antitoxin system prevent-host-death family antitoxin [Spirochaetota bacterium]
MQFITVRDLRTNPASIWRRLTEEHELIITNNGKPIALLTPISDSDLEDTLKNIRRAQAQHALSTLQKAALKDGRSQLGDDVIQQEINLARKERHEGRA